MKGNNELRLNEATMIEALQLWLDAQFKGPAPRVVSIEEHNSDTYCKEFKVCVDDKPKVTK